LLLISQKHSISNIQTIFKQKTSSLCKKSNTKIKKKIKKKKTPYFKKKKKKNLAIVSLSHSNYLSYDSKKKDINNFTNLQ